MLGLPLGLPSLYLVHLTGPALPAPLWFARQVCAPRLSAHSPCGESHRRSGGGGGETGGGGSQEPNGRQGGGGSELRGTRSLRPPRMGLGAARDCTGGPQHRVDPRTERGTHRPISGILRGETSPPAHRASRPGYWASWWPQAGRGGGAAGGHGRLGGFLARAGAGAEHTLPPPPLRAGSPPPPAPAADDGTAEPSLRPRIPAPAAAAAARPSAPRRGWTALHYSCTYGQPQIAYLLIQKNCNINALDKEKSTPLIKAAQCGNKVCLSILLHHGASPHPKDVHGYNALHYAVFWGNIWMAEMLLAGGANIEARTKRGFTPFLLAIHEQKEDVAEFLKAKGADVCAVVPRKCACLPVPTPKSPRQKRFKTEGKKQNTVMNEGSASASPPVPTPKPQRHKWFKTGGKKRDAVMNEGSASASPPVPTPKPPRHKWFKTGGKKRDTVMHEGSASASPRVPPPPAPGETLLETGGESDDAIAGEPSPSEALPREGLRSFAEETVVIRPENRDGVMDEAAASASARVPPPPAPGETLLESGGESDDDTTGEPSPSEALPREGLRSFAEETVVIRPENRDGVMDEAAASASPRVPPPPAPGETLLETGGESDDAIAGEPSPSEALPREGLRSFAEETVVIRPENRDGVMDEAAARFSKIPGPDVAGPPTTDKSSSNNEVGETPVTHLLSSGQRIPGLSEDVNWKPPPALDSGDSAYLTADWDLTELIQFIPLEMVLMLLILVCVLLCLLLPVMLAM